jgi:hypothetical protein
MAGLARLDGLGLKHIEKKSSFGNDIINVGDVFSIVEVPPGFRMQWIDALGEQPEIRMTWTVDPTFVALTSVDCKATNCGLALPSLPNVATTTTALSLG